MSSLIHQFRCWLADESVVYECRNCGTTLEEQQNTCPVCGVDDIARFDLD